MLAADVAQMILAEAKNYPAQALFVKMWTSFIGQKLKVRHILIRDAAFYFLTVAALKGAVQREGVLVYIYFPAHAAAMGSFIRFAFKAFIIFG